VTAEPTILTCTLCGKQVYSATPATYNREKIREAVDEHVAECPSRHPKAQRDEAHEVVAR